VKALCSQRLSWVVVGALAAALVLGGAGGAATGDNFILGQSNSAGDQTSLTGNLGAPVLRALNTGTAAAVRGDAQNGTGLNGTSVSGTGVQGQSQAGIGVVGQHTNATGTSPGVQGTTSSTDANGAGVVGRNTGGGAGLKSIVNAGVAPLAVNSDAKVTNLNGDKLDGLDSTAFWKLAGNAGTAPGTDFLGTTDNQALELKVNGARALRIEPSNASIPNLVGGFFANAVQSGVYGATIAGGGEYSYPNLVTDYFATVGGGSGNQAGDQDVLQNLDSASYATVAGGSENVAGGPFAAVGGGRLNEARGDEATVAGGEGNSAQGRRSAVDGGEGNTASGNESFVASGVGNFAGGDSSFVSGNRNTASGAASVVDGGGTNTASGIASAIGGGIQNTAYGTDSAVPGGFQNVAGGNYSLAAGTQAKATQDGSFVWGDRTFTDLTSPAVNTFSVRATGGIWLGTTSSPSIPAGRFLNTSTGGYLSSAGAWTNASDRALKHDFRPVDRRALLRRLARIPVESWSYKAEDARVRHIGPTAQDFSSAFGLGLDDKHIATIDEGGVALAAIQGLYRQNRALQARVAKLERIIARRTPR
jgi:trimeric autotransporter adhesin